MHRFTAGEKDSQRKICNPTNVNMTDNLQTMHAFDHYYLVRLLSPLVLLQRQGRICAVTTSLAASRRGSSFKGPSSVALALPMTQNPSHGRSQSQAVTLNNVAITEVQLKESIFRTALMWPSELARNYCEVY
jgi:hypothetical protein